MGHIQMVRSVETCRVLGEMLMKGSESYPGGEVCGDVSSSG